MHLRNILKYSAIVFTLAFVQWTQAADGNCACPSCHAADGCCYQDKISHRCVLVPDKKVIKKTVYECKELPYCLHRLPKVGECDCCPDCLACPRYKKVLIKREVVVAEICTTKCVIEEYVERVPGRCCQCGHDPAGHGKETGETPPTAPPIPVPDVKSALLPLNADYFPPVDVR